MISSGKTPSMSTATPGRTSSYKQAEPIPFGFGRHRLAVKWITPVLNWSFRTTKTSSYAYASVIGVVCLGPVDEVAEILINEKPYWGFFKFRAQSNADYIETVIPREGPADTETWRFYWGTETQANPTDHIRSLVGSQWAPDMLTAYHPSMKGVAWVSIKNLECGQSLGGNTPPLPNVEVIVNRMSPRALEAGCGYCAHGTNLIGASYDMLRDKRGGLALPASVFDEAHVTEKILEMDSIGVCGRKGQEVYASPLFIEPKSAAEYLSDIFKYFDGYLRRKNGKLEFGWQPNDGSSISATGLREISEHDMIDPVDLEPDGLEDLKTLVAVTGLDWQAPGGPMTEATETAQVPYAQELVGETRVERLSMPFFVSRDQIRACAAAMAVARATPNLSGSVKVPREKATHPDDITPLRPGDRFNLDYAPLELDLVCRITERLEEGDKSEVVLKFKRERGAVPQAYTPPLDPRAEQDAGIPPAINSWEIAEVPQLWISAPSVVALVERPHVSVTAWKLHYSPTDSWPGQELGSFVCFAVRTNIAAALGASATPGIIAITSASPEWSRIVSQGETAQRDDTLLAWSNGEWFSVGTINPQGGSAYLISVLRCRRGSIARSHGIGDQLWLAFRSDIESALVPHSDFRDTESQKWFKVQSLTGMQQGEVSASRPISLGSRAPATPTGLMATALTEGVYVSWDPPAVTSNVEATFIFERSASSPAPTVADTPTHRTTANSYTRSGISAGVERYFWIFHATPSGTPSIIEGPVHAIAMAAPRGPQGVPGEKGQDGAAGPQGPQGVPGVNGTDGVNGEDGIFREFVWKRAATQPAAPSGNGIPSGWYDDPPLGSDPLWMSVSKQELDGTLIDTWSAPIRHDGPPGAAGATGPQGPAGATAKLVVITSDAQVFKVDKAGANTPASITFTATGQNLTGSPSFSVTSGATLTGTGNTRSLAYSGLTTDAATITVTWDGMTDSISVAKARDGADGAAGSPGAAGAPGQSARIMLLSNESVTVPANSDGSNPVLSSANTYVGYFEGSNVVYPNPGEITVNAWNCTAVVDKPGTLWDHVTVTSMSQDFAWVDITFAPAGKTQITKRMNLAKSKAGISGQQGPQGIPGVNGTDGVNGDDGIFREFVWKRAATQPAAPSGNGIPSGWYDDPPLGSDPLWMSVSKQELDGTLIDTWSAPIRHDGPPGATGATGSTGAQGPQGVPGVNGTDGVNGEDGIFREFVWKRAATQPAAPSGNGIPSGWYDDPPLGSDPLWMSVSKQELDGTLIDTWSAPIRHDGPPGATGATGSTGAQGPQGPQGLAGMDGNFIYYLPHDQTPSNPSPKAGNLWFQTNRGNWIKRYTGTEWVDAMSSAFEIIDGVTYITQAAIRQVAAGSIVAGDVAALKLAIASAIRHPDYPGRYFRSSEWSTSYNASKSWAASSAFAFEHLAPVQFYGPGNNQGSSPTFCPNTSGETTFLINARIIDYSGPITIYRRINGGTWAACYSISSDDAGSAAVSAQRKFYDLGPTDRIELSVAPCDGNGNISSAVNGKWVNIEVLAFNWA
jgi:hypothetical protein